VVRRPVGQTTFEPLPFRWAVERTFAWLGRCRIHSRDYERDPRSSEAQVQISMIGLMLRRLAKEKHEAPFRYPRPARKRAA
ncbi:MAG TPA: transposase, partial [Isosphaeraceae bacterium]|nr:transposase [Isosphaeraceae bacterium]